MTWPARYRPKTAAELRAADRHWQQPPSCKPTPQARPYLKALPFLADSGYKGAGAGVLMPVRKPARCELEIDDETPNAPTLGRSNALDDKGRPESADLRASSSHDGMAVSRP